VQWPSAGGKVAQLDPEHIKIGIKHADVKWHEPALIVGTSVALRTILKHER
jgi:hypothetical protein